MAVEVPLSDRETAEELVRQASSFDERAEQLREQARALAYEAATLRASAANMLRAPVELLPKYHQRERNAELLDAVREAVRQIGPCSSSAVAEHCGISQLRARSALQTLEDSKAVKRTGLKRGTLWSDFDDDTLEGTGNRPDARTLVRDAACKLGCFTFPELSEALPYLSDVTIRRWLPELVKNGILVEVRVGTSKMYEHTKPTGPTPARPKRETPEQAAVRMLPPPRRGKAIKGTAIKGTGRGQRSGRALVDKLLRELRSIELPEGVELETVKTSHAYTFRIDGQVVASCSRTPGASSLKETRAHLIRAGIPVRPG